MRRIRFLRRREIGASIFRWFLLILFSVTVISVTIVIILNATGAFRGMSRDFPTSMLAVAIFVITSVIYAFVVRGIFQPLRDLSNATREIEKGNYNVQVANPSPKSAIGELISSFNHMARELNQVELFRNDFINNFSHEFKTPIVSIQGFANRLIRSGLSDRQKQEYAEIIAAEAKRLSGMASNVLMLNKYENQEIVTEKHIFSLDEQLRLCVLAQQEKWMARELEPDVNLAPVSICGNEEMLSQVWTNLIDNAIKFSHPGGHFAISCCYEGEAVRVMIRDEGCGMSEEVRAHIFEKFYQGDPAHKSSGNGLGLAIVHRIVVLCGGHITVESSPNCGTTFWITLPIGSALPE